MAKKLQIDTEGELDYVPEQYRTGTSLSEIKKVSPSELKMNELNSKYFRTESEDYFNKLRDDVRKRGIIVPLIAKKDGTLLSGHNRLQVAIELDLKRIPVMYVLEDLSEEREKEILIKDNLTRRQLSNEERIQLYKTLYPDFEATFLHSEVRSLGGRKNKNDTSLTYSKIAKDTGQNIDTVKKQVLRERNKLHREVVRDSSGGSNKNGDNVPVIQSNKSYKKNGDNVPVSKRNTFNNTNNTLSLASASLQQLETIYKEATPEIRKALKEEIMQFVGKIAEL